MQWWQIYIFVALRMGQRAIFLRFVSVFNLIYHKIAYLTCLFDELRSGRAHLSDASFDDQCHYPKLQNLKSLNKQAHSSIRLFIFYFENYDFVWVGGSVLFNCSVWHSDCETTESTLVTIITFFDDVLWCTHAKKFLLPFHTVCHGGQAQCKI